MPNSTAENFAEEDGFTHETGKCQLFGAMERTIKARKTLRLPAVP
jgi:hypothetical protein